MRQGIIKNLQKYFSNNSKNRKLHIYYKLAWEPSAAHGLLKVTLAVYPL